MSVTWLELIYPGSSRRVRVNSRKCLYWQRLTLPNIPPTEQSGSSLALHVGLDDVNHVESAEGVAVPEIVFPSLL